MLAKSSTGTTQVAQMLTQGCVLPHTVASFPNADYKAWHRDWHTRTSTINPINSAVVLLHDHECKLVASMYQRQHHPHSQQTIPLRQTSARCRAHCGRGAAAMQSPSSRNCLVAQHTPHPSSDNVTKDTALLPYANSKRTTILCTVVKAVLQLSYVQGHNSSL